MSRIGKQPITVPTGVTMTLKGRHVSVKGPKGELTRTLHENVTMSLADNAAAVTVASPENHRDRALWGLSRMLVQNMVTGVTDGFSKALEVHGVGYRVALQGTKLVFNIGYSHPVEFVLPEGISATVAGNVITVSGADKEVVGESAARIRRIRKPEPYKGKGIRYVGEVVRRKAGKVVKGSA